MTFIRKHKKLLLYAGVLALVVVGVLIFTDNAWAQAKGAVAKGVGATAALGFLKSATDATIGVFILAGILWGLSLALYGLLTVAGTILNFIFEINILFNPIADPLVILVWSYARDIVNAIFILIILWIALTIIFNLENLGGRKLLIKVIITALLINFSLAFVGAAFGFANQLALPFKNAISEKGDVSGVITSYAHLQTTLAVVNNPELFEEVKEASKGAEASGQALNDLKELSNPSFAHYLGIKEAHALPQIVAALLVGLVSGVAYIAGVTIAEYATGLLSFLTGGAITESILKTILNYVVIDVFLLLTVLAFITAAIILMARLIAMFFLAVLAPFALGAAALPSESAQSLFNTWLRNLVRWAFYAPAFYFLLYLSILVLVSLSSVPTTFYKGEVVPLQGDLLKLFNLTLFIAFLWASIIVARKMGITVADGFINWGQKWIKQGLWYPPTVLGRTGLGYLRRIGAQASRVERALPRTPFIPTLARKAAQRFGAYERDAIDEARKKLKPLSSAELQRRSSMPFTTSTERGAILLELAEKGDIEREPGVDEAQWGPTQIRQGVRELRGKGKNVIDILRARPDIATTEFAPKAAADIAEERRSRMDAFGISESGAKYILPDATAPIWSVVSGMKPSHIAKMERQAVLNFESVRRAFWHSRNFRGEHIGQMARTDPRMSNAMGEELQKILDDTRVPQAEKDRLERDFKEYLTGTLAQGLITIPRQWRVGGGTPGNPASPAGSISSGPGQLFVETRTEAEQAAERRAAPGSTPGVTVTRLGQSAGPTSEEEGGTPQAGGTVTPYGEAATSAERAARAAAGAGARAGLKPIPEGTAKEAMPLAKPPPEVIGKPPTAGVETPPPEATAPTSRRIKIDKEEWADTIASKYPNTPQIRGIALEFVKADLAGKVSGELRHEWSELRGYADTYEKILKLPRAKSTMEEYRRKELERIEDQIRYYSQSLEKKLKAL